MIMPKPNKHNAYMKIQNYTYETEKNEIHIKKYL